MEVTLQDINWEQFSIYLFGDLKLSRGKHDANVYTLKSRFKALQRWFIENKLEFNRYNLTCFTMELQKAGQSNSTVNKFIGLAKIIFKFLNRFEEIRDYNYYQETPPDKDPLTAVEMAAIRNVQVKYRKPIIAKRYYCLYFILELYGPRINEVLDLRFKDISHSTITFCDTKNGDTRKCIMLPELYDSLMELKETNNPMEEVFKTHYDSDINEDARDRAKLCGIKKHVHTHLWRASVATIIAANCKDTQVVCDFMGWRDINTIKRYVKANMDSQRDMLLQHHPLWQSYEQNESLNRRISNFIAHSIQGKKFEHSNNENAEVFRIYDSQGKVTEVRITKTV